MEILDKEKFHISARRGVISLLEKLGENLLKIDNWRPITLLCADFKIVDKVFALRIQNAIPEIINNAQVGFQKGKIMGENILKLMTVIDYCESEGALPSY